jgi:hypothetical protein
MKTISNKKLLKDAYRAIFWPEQVFKKIGNGQKLNYRFVVPITFIWGVIFIVFNFGFAQGAWIFQWSHAPVTLVSQAIFGFLLWYVGSLTFFLIGKFFKKNIKLEKIEIATFYLWMIWAVMPFYDLPHLIFNIPMATIFGAGAHLSWIFAFPALAFGTYFLLKDVLKLEKKELRFVIYGISLGVPIIGRYFLENIPIYINDVLRFIYKPAGYQRCAVVGSIVVLILAIFLRKYLLKKITLSKFVRSAAIGIFLTIFAWTYLFYFTPLKDLPNGGPTLFSESITKSEVALAQSRHTGSYTWTSSDYESGTIRHPATGNSNDNSDSYWSNAYVDSVDMDFNPANVSIDEIRVKVHFTANTANKQSGLGPKSQGCLAGDTAGAGTYYCSPWTTNLNGASDQTFTINVSSIWSYSASADGSAGGSTQWNALIAAMTQNDNDVLVHSWTQGDSNDSNNANGDVIEYDSVVVEVHYNTAAELATSGSQTSTLQIGSTGNYVGGNFAVTSNGGSFNVTGVTIAEQGSVDAQNNLANAKLYYDLDTSAPYDCASESYAGGESQFGSTTGFNGADGTAAFSGSVAVSSTQTMCVYAVLDVGTGATASETIELQITNPSTQVTLSSGITGSTTPVAISGTTTLATAAEAATSGSQTSTLKIGTTNNYVGGNFKVTSNGGSFNVTGVTIAEQGSVDAQNNLANVKLYYDLDSSAPYDCASESYAGGESQFGSTTSFNGTDGTASFTGTAAVSSTQTMCMYVVLDIGAGATPSQTLEIQITNPKTQVVLSSGVVTSSSPVAISGTTTLVANATVGTSGSQTASVTIPGTGKYVGGNFTIISNGDSFNVTGITVAEQGSVDAQNNLANAKLYYDLDTSSPYDCASESYAGGESQFGSTTSFNGANGTASFSGSVAVSATQAMCVYAVLDVGAGATVGQTIELQITNPTSNVVLSSGVAGPSSAVAISGTTTLIAAATVATSGTQTSTMTIPVTGKYVGGNFKVTSNSESFNVTGVTIAEQGTVDAQNNLSNVKLYYDLDSSAPYDCASESYAGGESQFGTATSFNSANGTASFSGSVAVSSTQTMCIYAVLDVGTGATVGQTLEIEITNPSSQVALSSGSASPGTAVAISGTTSFIAAALVSTSGTQTSSMDIPSTNNYVGGNFKVTSNGGSFNVTGITITEQGTVDAQATLANVKLYYDLDSSAPYDCASESYAGGESQFGSTTGFNGANGTAAFSGSVAVSTTQTVCVYAVVDVLEGFAPGVSMEIEISNPSTQVALSSGPAGPASAVAISGTTYLSNAPSSPIIFGGPSQNMIFGRGIIFK